ncbi:hypothetical protein DQ04_01631070 [Trypanosoma grayi]|uniref:hypothetical protein n=1 Tax=Trypanosoma grayi TaxID=71804 RepID=UPI0004F43ED5|nr:hypothetical protein DQ04_01631070 [Trypanosoma grayi]KEG12541.1 hypothetical protein DQ04_01631070 [Trypanosoma grayi]
MSEVHTVAASVGGSFLVLGCADGLKAYRLSATEPIQKLIPSAEDASALRGCRAVGGSVGVVAVLGTTPLIAFALDSGTTASRTTAAAAAAATSTAEMGAEGIATCGVSASTARVLCLYDALARQPIAELHFDTAVVGVRLNSKRLIVALAEFVHVFDLKTLRHLAELRTTSPRNPDGLLVLSDPTTNPRGDAVSYFAFPQSDSGLGDVWVAHVTEEQMDHDGQGGSTPDTFSCNRCGVVERMAIVKAHNCAVVCLAMTRDGTRLATASVRGTTVKVFEPATARLLYVFRRGLTPARMLALSFDASTDLSGLQLAALSSRGTLHIFRCTSSGGDELIAPYPGTETRSFAQATVSKSSETASTAPNLCVESKKGRGGRYCFFSENGRLVWVVLPARKTVLSDDASLRDGPGDDAASSSEGKAGNGPCWVLHEYAIHMNGCELMKRHELN